MKWKIARVLIVKWLAISVVGCWPFQAPPLPQPPLAPPPIPPMPPLHMFEDHYIRVSHGPHIDRGLTHMASQTSGAFQPINQNLFYSMPPQMLYSAERPLRERPSRERLYDDNRYDLGITREFSTRYSAREPQQPIMRVRESKYRYRKRMKSQKPIDSSTETTSSVDNTYNSEVNYEEIQSTNNNNNNNNNNSPANGQPPRRYNVIHSNSRLKSGNNLNNNIPNSVNDKLDQISTKKVVFDEDNNYRRNKSENIHRIWKKLILM
ncbi:GATA zinc finger domain-containing protein 4-like [Oppia nitens]|uniref:GATA zinc finger domain-containing protein 4-like n=1 Tax=Oppia nitens TaxID=1686743 RepID=UPI0023DC851B|nr:GATA zinc finger domain-containing protein 4-like [Oppia nitens]